ncbi:MAG TPA: L-seryl-tRNA(Sec) selenium transferase [Gaiellales bacterium]
MSVNPLRGLPSVDSLLRSTGGRDLVERHGHQAAAGALRAALADARAGGTAIAAHDLVTAAAERLSGPPSLRSVLNATGVIVHTNLGRAPLATAAVERVVDVATGYSTLEYDIATGRRGSRHDHLSGLLAGLTGAEAGLAVNNNAAAVLLCLAATAEGGEVLISRGQLIEIGDGFRIPDILTQSGARLVEVGTTNRTHLGDYERAVTDRTRAILRVHQSNFRIVGFTDHPGLAELATVARPGIALIDDLGSGALLDLPDMLDEPTARSSIDAGADLVCFSGDKLLGGPQAGILVGRGELVEKLRTHPLHRAVRADKLTLAALEGTLRLYLDAPGQVPVLRMLDESVDLVRARAERLASLVDGRVEETVGRVGGGALPLAELSSFACAIDETLAAPLRGGEPPVVGIVRDGMLLLDCRTLTDDEVDEVAAAVTRCR